jgi:hypothetical protein
MTCWLSASSCAVEERDHRRSSGWQRASTSYRIDCHKVLITNLKPIPAVRQWLHGGHHGGPLMTWTHITDPDEAASLFPTWLGRRVVGLHGRFGLLLATGDVMRVTSIGAVHHSSDGVILLDVSLDSAGVPEGVDLAWQPKQFLGVPVPGASMATVNLAHVVAVVEFSAAEMAGRVIEIEAPTADEVVMELGRVAGQIQEIDLTNRETTRPDRVGGSTMSTGGDLPAVSSVPLEVLTPVVDKSLLAKPTKKAKKRKK